MRRTLVRRTTSLTLLLCSGKYCGNNFPPIITSSGRFLWLRFRSDETIQYMGFKAVYTFIENPLEHAPDIGNCAFDVEGYQVSRASVQRPDETTHTVQHASAQSDARFCHVFRQ